MAMFVCAAAITAGTIPDQGQHLEILNNDGSAGEDRVAVAGYDIGEVVVE